MPDPSTELMRLLKNILKEQQRTNSLIEQLLLLEEKSAVSKNVNL